MVGALMGEQSTARVAIRGQAGPPMIGPKIAMNGDEGFFALQLHCKSRFRTRGKTFALRNVLFTLQSRSVTNQLLGLLSRGRHLQ